MKINEDTKFWLLYIAAFILLHTIAVYGYLVLLGIIQPPNEVYTSIDGCSLLSLTYIFGFIAPVFDILNLYIYLKVLK